GGDDAVALALEGVREELLDSVLVVDKQDGRGLGHSRTPAGRRSIVRLPTIAPDVDSPGDGPAPPRAARLARPADQRTHVAGHLAPRRLPAAARRVHRLAPGRAAATGAAGRVRHRGGETACGRSGNG